MKDSTAGSAPVWRWWLQSVVFGLAAATSASAGTEPGVVQTTSGPVRGQLAADVYSYKGMPFAAPPVGSLRWRAPAPVKPWADVREAFNYGPPCAQAEFEWNRAVAAASREDCLYLNVWVPLQHKSDSLPVMVFFPGGAYHGGSARGLSAIEPAYDGAKLARRGVVVVTANYRLGMFGFLAHPQLTAESPWHGSGNYALLDNIAALQWVRDNIARFGGDPRNVTAFGQSAGAWSVTQLMTSRLARGLFARAMLLSGPIFDASPGQLELRDAQAAGVAFAQGLGVAPAGAIAELRRRPAQDLLRAMMADQTLRRAEPRGGVIDGHVLTQQPVLVFRKGEEMAIPLIVGSTARDGDFDNMGVSGTAKADATLADKARPVARLHSVRPLAHQDDQQIQDFYAPYQDLARQASNIYRDTSSTDSAYGDVVTAFYTDTRMRCGSSLIARLHARVAPTWQYEFSHGYEPLGAVHLWDLLYVFGWLQAPADQPRDVHLEDEVQRYMTAFAASGNPNTSELPAWPQSGTQGAYLDFASDSTLSKTGLRSAACDVFARRTEQALDVLARGKSGR